MGLVNGRIQKITVLFIHLLATFATTLYAVTSTDLVSKTPKSYTP